MLQKQKIKTIKFKKEEQEMSEKRVSSFAEDVRELGAADDSFILISDDSDMETFARICDELRFEELLSLLKGGK